MVTLKLRGDLLRVGAWCARDGRGEVEGAAEKVEKFTVPKRADHMQSAGQHRLAYLPSKRPDAGPARRRRSYSKRVHGCSTQAVTMR